MKSAGFEFLALISDDGEPIAKIKRPVIAFAAFLSKGRFNPPVPAEAFDFPDELGAIHSYNRTVLSDFQAPSPSSIPDNDLAALLPKALQRRA